MLVLARKPFRRRPRGRARIVAIIETTKHTRYVRCRIYIDDPVLLSSNILRLPTYYLALFFLFKFPLFNLLSAFLCHVHSSAPLRSSRLPDHPHKISPCIQ